MWKSNRISKKEGKVLHWQDFPVSNPTAEELTVPYIASYLRQMLEKYEESEFVKYLVIPSPKALSGIFHCPQTEVYYALDELQQQGYGAETSGDKRPIILWDPLIRPKTTRHQEPYSWRFFYEMFINRPKQTTERTTVS